MADKFKKVYIIFYSEDGIDKPDRWVVEKKPLWLITSHMEKSITSMKDPNNGFGREDSLEVNLTADLFNTKKEADTEAKRRNEAGIKG